MSVHLNENEMDEIPINSSIDTDDPLKRNELLIPIFNILHIMVGNENGSNRISSISLYIDFNSKYISLLKTLLVRYSENTTIISHSSHTESCK